MKRVFLWLIVLAAILSGLKYVTEDSNQRTATVEPQPVAEISFHANAVAKSLTAAPGAIVCSDLATVQLLFKLYVTHWEDTNQDAATNGQSQDLRGKSAPTPDPKIYGCSLLVPGTPIQVENPDAFTTGIPRVTVKLPDGKLVHGITLPSMLGRL